MTVVQDNIKSKEEARVYEQMYMILNLKLILKNRIRSISVANMHNLNPSKDGSPTAHEILLNIVGDQLENEVLALMDEVKF